jgi:hypothetical protein
MLGSLRRDGSEWAHAGAPPYANAIASFRNPQLVTVTGRLLTRDGDAS